MKSVEKTGYPIIPNVLTILSIDNKRNSKKELNTLIDSTVVI